MIKFCILPFLSILLILAPNISFADYSDKFGNTKTEASPWSAYVNLARVSTENLHPDFREAFSLDQNVWKIENPTSGDAKIIYSVSGVNKINLSILHSIGSFATRQINPRTGETEAVLGAPTDPCTSPILQVFQSENDELYINYCGKWEKCCYSQDDANFPFKSTTQTFTKSDLGRKLKFCGVNVYTSKDNEHFTFVPFCTKELVKRITVFPNGIPFYLENISFPIPEGTIIIKISISNFNIGPEFNLKNLILIAGVKLIGNNLVWGVSEHFTPSATSEIAIKSQTPREVKKSKTPLSPKLTTEKPKAPQKQKFVKPDKSKIKLQNKPSFTAESVEIKQMSSSAPIVSEEETKAEITTPTHQSYESLESFVKQATGKRKKIKSKPKKQTTIQPKTKTKKQKPHKRRSKKTNTYMPATPQNQDNSKLIFLKNSTSSPTSKVLPPSKQILGVAYITIASGAIAWGACGGKILFRKKFK